VLLEKPNLDDSALKCQLLDELEKEVSQMPPSYYYDVTFERYNYFFANVTIPIQSVA
jgi:intein/homing endonuclease